jgi:hypothetical protein
VAGSTTEAAAVVGCAGPTRTETWKQSLVVNPLERLAKGSGRMAKAYGRNARSAVRRDGRRGRWTRRLPSRR